MLGRVGFLSGHFFPIASGCWAPRSSASERSVCALVLEPAIPALPAQSTTDSPCSAPGWQKGVLVLTLRGILKALLELRTFKVLEGPLLSCYLVQDAFTHFSSHNLHFSYLETDAKGG